MRMYAYSYYVYIYIHITNEWLPAILCLYGNSKVKKVKRSHESCEILAINSTDAEKYLWSFQRSAAEKP